LISAPIARPLQHVADGDPNLIALATERAFPHFVGSGTFFRGWANMALGESIQDAKATSHYSYGVVLLFQAEFTVALQHLRQAIAVHNRLILVPVDPTIAGPSFAAWALLFLGYPDQALVLGRQAVASAREFAYPYRVAYSLHVNCVFHQLLGDATIVREREKKLRAWPERIRADSDARSPRCCRRPGATIRD
jgi:hypothetical protein